MNPTQTLLDAMAKTLYESVGTAKLNGACPCCTPMVGRDYRSKRVMPPEEMLTVQLLEDLRGSALVIKRVGWTQGNWYAPTGVCGLGAAQVYMSGQAAPNPTLFAPGGQLQPRYENVARALHHWLGVPMPTFNDHVATKPEDVIGEIEALAFEVERYLCQKHGTWAIRTKEEVVWQGNQFPGWQAGWIKEGEVKPLQGTWQAQMEQACKLPATLDTKALAEALGIPAEDFLPKPVALV